MINSDRQRLSVELLTGYRHFEDVLVVLKEQAKKAGLELKLKILEPTAAWKAANEKNHQVIFSAFNSFVELFQDFGSPITLIMLIRSLGTQSLMKTVPQAKPDYKGKYQ